MKAINIIWEVDSEDELGFLPDEIEIPAEVIASAEDDGDYKEVISDYISDVTGYCHKGFTLDDKQNWNELYKLSTMLDEEKIMELARQHHVALSDKAGRIL